MRNTPPETDRVQANKNAISIASRAAICLSDQLLHRPLDQDDEQGDRPAEEQDPSCCLGGPQDAPTAGQHDVAVADRRKGHNREVDSFFETGDRAERNIGARPDQHFEDVKEEDEYESRGKTTHRPKESDPSGGRATNLKGAGPRPVPRREDVAI